ncbi:MAG: anion permease, partial [bacterium]
YLSRHHGHELDFARWMTAAMPLVLILLPLVWLLLTRVLHPLGGVPALADRSFVRATLTELGPLSGAEWTTVAVFLAAVAWWTGRDTFCRLLGLGDLHPDGTWVPRLSDAGV